MNIYEKTPEHKQFLINFGKRLEKIRLKKKYSATAMATVVGQPRARYLSYEKGLVEPKLFNIARICEFLEITANDLFYDNIDDIGNETHQQIKTTGEIQLTPTELEFFENIGCEVTCFTQCIEIKTKILYGDFVNLIPDKHKVHESRPIEFYLSYDKYKEYIFYPLHTAMKAKKPWNDNRFRKWLSTSKLLLDTIKDLDTAPF